MSSSKKRYWLKGGIFLSVLFLIINVIFFPSGSIGILIPINIPGALIIYLLGYNIMDSPFFDMYGVLMIIASTIFWFFVGSIFGLIYGIIKNKIKKTV